MNQQTKTRIAIMIVVTICGLLLLRLYMRHSEPCKRDNVGTLCIHNQTGESLTIYLDDKLFDGADPDETICSTLPADDYQVTTNTISSDPQRTSFHTSVQTCKTIMRIIE